MAEEYISHLHRQLADVSFDHPDRAFLEEQLQKGYEYLRSGRRDQLVPISTLSIATLQVDAGPSITVIEKGDYSISESARALGVSINTFRNMLARNPDITLRQNEDDKREKVATAEQLNIVARKYHRLLILDPMDNPDGERRPPTTYRTMSTPKYQERKFIITEVAKELGIDIHTLKRRMEKLQMTSEANDNDRRTKFLTGAQIKQLAELGRH